jgi:uncharacterized protein (TIGR02145 family)
MKKKNRICTYPLIMMVVLFMLTVALKTKGQNYIISFAATGASTSLDSVKVQNLTKGTSLSISGTDVLNLKATTSINNQSVSKETAIIYPNPMQDQAELSFYAKQTANTQLTILNLAGKEILQMNNNLSKGIQRYRIAGLKQGMYFINISSEQYFYTSKLISLSTTQNEVKMEYLGSEKAEFINMTFKSIKSTVDMPYTTGDRLLIKGISGNFSTIITDVPTASKTVTFNFTACTDTDNNNYSVVKIGTQTWMAENLKVTKYRDGTTIPNVTDNITWVNLTTGAYCDYFNTPGYSIIYGKLYNFFTVVDSRNLCPTGWHVPSDAEWTTLTTYLGGDAVAGDKLKETGLTHFLTQNKTATNETGFTALPAGTRTDNGPYILLGEFGSWWNSNEYNTTKALYCSVGNSVPIVGRGNIDKIRGISVRCLQD